MNRSLLVTVALLCALPLAGGCGKKGSSKDAYPAGDPPAGALSSEACRILDGQFQQLWQDKKIAPVMDGEGNFHMKSVPHPDIDTGYAFTADDGGVILVQTDLVLGDCELAKGARLRKQSGWWVREPQGP